MEFKVEKYEGYQYIIRYPNNFKKGEKYVCNFLNLLDEHISQTFEENKLKTIDKNIKSINEIFSKNRSK